MPFTIEFHFSAPVFQPPRDPAPPAHDDPGARRGNPPMTTQGRRADETSRGNLEKPEPDAEPLRYRDLCIVGGCLLAIVAATVAIVRLVDLGLDRFYP